MVNSLVTFGLSMRLEIALDPPLGPYCKLVFLSQSTEPIFMDLSVLSLLYSSKRFMYVLLYMRDRIITRIHFYQIVLCLNMTSYWESDSRSLNQH